MLKGNKSVNEKQKLKMKKNAMEYVDYESEKKLDPKYKTEMCKSWTDTNFCVYGNKCRFAHGKQELFGKPVSGSKYKLKECNSFKQNGICMYGARCNFKHDERKLNDIDRSFFSLLPLHGNSRRLRIFESVSPSSSPLNLSASDSFGEVPCFVPNYLFIGHPVIPSGLPSVIPSGIHYGQFPPVFQPVMVRPY